jgi:UDP-GlcNAc3NAcA epimerase
MKKRLLTIVGARPQFVKASAVSRALSTLGAIEEVLVHTGQHFDAEMSDVFFDQLGMAVPKYNLDIHDLPHGAMTGRMIEKIETLFPAESPDAVLVYGDTNSTLAGALAAAKAHIRVIHVEAGLRSFDKRMPEEVNRVLTDHVSSVLYCPTRTAVDNLKAESITSPESRVLLVGDVMLDVALKHRQESSQQTAPYALCTLHREENTSDISALRDIFGALDIISRELPIVMPVHPRTKARLTELKLKTEIELIPPQGYSEMISLVAGSRMVLTDSGGLQKEAYFLGKPCITLRSTTEWTELVEAGCNILTGADPAAIVAGFWEMLERSPNFDAKLYGDGFAAETIAEDLATYLE